MPEADESPAQHPLSSLSGYQRSDSQDSFAQIMPLAPLGGIHWIMAMLL
jgi:hypothetical protein